MVRGRCCICSDHVSCSLECYQSVDINLRTTIPLALNPSDIWKPKRGMVVATVSGPSPSSPVFLSSSTCYCRFC